MSPFGIRVRTTTRPNPSGELGTTIEEMDESMETTMNIKAKWNGRVLAESPEVIVVDGYSYFPPQTVDHTLLEPSSHRTTCPRKGIAHYFDVRLGDVRTENAAWTYPDPKPVAENIRDRIAFWKDIEVG